MSGRNSPLLKVLERCYELTSKSNDPTWSDWDCNSILRELDQAIHAVRHKAKPDITSLRLLFAPTGALQETSIDNGWGAEFLKLAAEFDRVIKTG